MLADKVTIPEQYFEIYTVGANYYRLNENRTNYLNCQENQLYAKNHLFFGCLPDYGILLCTAPQDHHKRR
jgi:hypothetical protein